MAKIAFFEVPPVEQDYLKNSSLAKHELTFYEGRAQDADMSTVRQTDILSVFIYSQLSAALLKKYARLKLVATRSTGYDHIDLSTCKKQKITVSNVPSYGENTVAEHTFALILALSRKVHEAYVRTTRGNFSFEGLQGFDLQGKILGVVGTGHIGLHAIRIARGFGMKAIAYDVKENSFMAETLGFEYVPFDALLRKSDILTLHAPYNTHTHHMINKKTIKMMKRGSILINTARGALVETEALAEALDRGHLAGAGLDVLEGENLIKEERQILAQEFSKDHLKTLLQNHILLNRPNVVITPHIGFNSKEASLRILDTTVSNIESFLIGKPTNAIATAR